MASSRTDFILPAPCAGRGSPDGGPRRRFSTQTYCPICCNWFPAVCPFQLAVKNSNSYCVECLASIFPFNGIVDDLEFRMAIKGLRFLPNFDYLRVQSDTSLIINRPHMADRDIDVDDGYYYHLANLSVQYLDTYQLTQKLTLHVTDLSLLHFNSRSLKKNGSRAKIELDQLQWKFPVIAVTETWTTEEDTNTIFSPAIVRSSSPDPTTTMVGLVFYE